MCDEGGFIPGPGELIGRHPFGRRFVVHIATGANRLAPERVNRAVVDDAQHP